MSTHQQIKDAYESYLIEHTKFEEKEVKVSAARARAALGDLGKLAKIRRAEIQEKKNRMIEVSKATFTD
jgi:hypothetical protein